MQSLRTRKPSEARPKGQRQGTRSVRPANAAARKSTWVDDKIKKRMSMRYADISGPTNAAVPAVPSLPIGVRPGAYSGPDESSQFTDEPQEDPKISELRLLDDDKFDPDAYMKLKLANSTEAQLRTLQSSLRSQKDEVATDLASNVFKNYAEFVLVSKEVSTLENEMLEFKDSLAEWKGMPSLLHIDESASVADRRRNVRSSIADLRVLYATQLQNLHAQIEGSSKFVPTIPGRHIVAEIDNITALNPATYKVDHHVRFVLLDDSVLVARRRRRRNNAESDKLVAERCWSLNEMLVLDTKDSANLTNVFKVRHGKETHVYRTEIASDKKNLLSQFRSIAEELAARKRREREGEHQRRKSVWVADRSSMIGDNIPAMPAFPEWMADLAGKSELGSSAKEKAEQDARWIGEFSDDLTVAIALREWDTAVSLVEQGEEKLTAMPALGVKLLPLRASLTSALLQSLAMPSNRKTAIVHLVSLLVRLKAGAAARTTFLSARAEILRKRIRTISFEGHIGMYINDLATVMFAGIKHTADWYLNSFKENRDASCLVEWSKGQVEVFAEMFRSQVYGSDIDAETIDEAHRVAHLQSKKYLEEYGIDFRFLLENLLEEKPKSNNRPPQFRQHVQKEPDPIYTPTPTPTRSRSNSVRSTPAQADIPPVPPIPLDIAGLTPGRTPLPSIRSPVPRTPSAASGLSSGPIARSPRSSPAPPPRSRDRPGSSLSARPVPVAVPRRENMF